MRRIYNPSVRTNLQDDELEDQVKTVDKTTVIRKVFLSKSPTKPRESILISPRPAKRLSLFDLYNEWVNGNLFTSKYRRKPRYRNLQQIKSTVIQDHSTTHSNTVSSQNMECTSDQVINMSAGPSSSIENHSYFKPSELKDPVFKQPLPRKRSRKSGKLPVKRISTKQRKTELFDNNSSLKLMQEFQQMEPLDLRMPNKKQEFNCTPVDVSWANSSTKICQDNKGILYPTPIPGNETPVSPKAGGSNYRQINVGANETLQQYTYLGSSVKSVNFLSGISQNYGAVDPVIMTAKNTAANPSAFEFNYKPASVKINDTFNYLQMHSNPYPGVSPNPGYSQNFVNSLSGTPDNSIITENNAALYSAATNYAPVKVKESYAVKQQSNTEYPLYYYNPIYEITQNRQSLSMGCTANGCNCEAVNTGIRDAFKQQPTLKYLPYYNNPFPEAFQKYTASINPITEKNNDANAISTSGETSNYQVKNVEERSLLLAKEKQGMIDGKVSSKRTRNSKPKNPSTKSVNKKQPNLKKQKLMEVSQPQNNNSRNITITSYERDATRNFNVLMGFLQMLKAYQNPNGKSELPECNRNNSQLQESNIKNDQVDPKDTIITESVTVEREESPEVFTGIRERFSDKPVKVYFNKKKI